MYLKQDEVCSKERLHPHRGSGSDWSLANRPSVSEPVNPKLSSGTVRKWAASVLESYANVSLTQSKTEKIQCNINNMLQTGFVIVFSSA